MRHNFYFLLMALVLFQTKVIADEEVDSLAWKRLIFSEARLTNRLDAQYAFVELYNASDDTIDLADYWFQTGWNNFRNAVDGDDIQKVSATGTLAPGETYIISAIKENESENEWGERIYPNDYYNIVLQEISDFTTYGRGFNDGTVGATILLTDGRIGLYYRGDTSTIEGVVARDSVMVDKFGPIEADGTSHSDFPIAGVLAEDPSWDGQYVRKTLYTKGNTNWDESRGTNKDDSEWIWLPRHSGGINDILFTTVGVHLNQTELDMVPKKSTISINKNSKEIVFPYGIRRDSLFREFTYGPNHAWELRIGADTSQWYVTTGDSIDIYVCGDAVQKHTFVAKVEDISSEFVQARPLTYKSWFNDNWITRYTISEGLNIDTIGDIPYSTPVDTFLKYLVIEEGATAEFVWSDGVEKPELYPNGDKFVVSNGTAKKEYVLSVNRFAPNQDPRLRSIILPGHEIFLNSLTFEYTDTIMPFSMDNPLYIVNLPLGTEAAPAIIAKSNNSRAMVTIKRAKNLFGSEDDRTASIIVTAEDTDYTKEYKILFNVERETPPITGEPFFSDFATGWGGGHAQWTMQIFNPSDEVVFLSDYVIVKHRDDSDPFASFVDYTNTGNKSLMGDRTSLQNLNKYIMRPGYMIKYDDNNEPIFGAAPIFTTDVLEPKEVYSMVGIGRAWPYNAFGDGENLTGGLADKIDMGIGSRNPHSYTKNWQASIRTYWENRLNYVVGDQTTGPYATSDSKFWLFNASDAHPGPQTGDSYMLYKIKNDSIIDGSKPVHKNFLEDYELVDVINGPSLQGIQWKIYDKNLAGNDTAYHFTESTKGHQYPCLYRKPWVYSGNPEQGAAFGNEAKEGEWAVYGILPDGGISANTVEGVTLGRQEFGQTRFENHTMISYAHIPYISSSVYVIGRGLEGTQPIIGVTSGTDVDGFMANINKPDTAMQVSVSSASGVVKSGAEEISSGDKVISVAANGKTQVEYEITVGALSNDVSLTAKSNATVTVDGLTIKQVQMGTTVNELLEMVEAHASATITITDGDERIIPLEQYPADTIMQQNFEKVDVLLSEKYVVEVQAQNGVDVAKYAIAFNEAATPYVISDVYTVMEDDKYINFVWGINVANFLNNLIASHGASMRVVNKLGQERTVGGLQYHDRLEVTKEGVTVVYYIKFSTEEENVDAVEGVEIPKLEGIYPNPTSDGLITISNLQGVSYVKIHNVAGKLVKMVSVNNSLMRVDLGSDNGLYIVSKYYKNGQVTATKVVKH